MDPRLEQLADQGYDVSNDPRTAARSDRRRGLARGLLAVALVAAVPLGLAVTDEVQERRAEAALPDLASALDALVAEHPARVPPVDAGEQLGASMPYGDAARAWDQDRPLEPLAVGVPVLADPAAGGRSLLACVRLDPWLGGEHLRCVPLDEPDAEPVELSGGGVLYLLENG